MGNTLLEDDNTCKFCITTATGYAKQKTTRYTIIYFSFIIFSSYLQIVWPLLGPRCPYWCGKLAVCRMKCHGGCVTAIAASHCSGQLTTAVTTSVTTAVTTAVTTGDHSSDRSSDCRWPQQWPSGQLTAAVTAGDRSVGAPRCVRAGRSRPPAVCAQRASHTWWTLATSLTSRSASALTTGPDYSAQSSP